VAVALAQAGAAVAVAARDRHELEVTVGLVKRAGGRAVGIPTDVARYRDVEALMDGTIQRLGRLDVVVNNAGVARVAPLAELDPDDWRHVIDVNLTGVFHGCRAAARHLIAQHAGKVINLASVLGAVGLAGYTAYGASKGGVIALTRTLGVEWARHNIQVNAIAPGWFATEMSAPAFDDPRISERLTRDIPARRRGDPAEIGPLAVYLASPASDYMTGQTLFIDGGRVAV
jgi:2-deoxy-D-gluconate 3-dehydrogenase